AERPFWTMSVCWIISPQSEPAQIQTIRSGAVTRLAIAEGSDIQAPRLSQSSHWATSIDVEVVEVNHHRRGVTARSAIREEETAMGRGFELTPLFAAMAAFAFLIIGPARADVVSNSVSIPASMIGAATPVVVNAHHDTRRRRQPDTQLVHVDVRLSD